MDTQRKKGVLDIAVLAVLTRGPSYGYRIANEISSVIEIGESTLYPILRRLEGAGCLTTYTEAYGGRTRKYFELTETGRERIRAFLTEWEQMERIYQFVSQNSEEVRG